MERAVSEKYKKPWKRIVIAEQAYSRKTLIDVMITPALKAWCVTFQRDLFA